MGGNMADPMQQAAPVIHMLGAGYFSEHTTGAKRVIDNVIPLALGALAEIDLAGNSAFGIADFGAADGGTSISLHHAVLAAIRARAPGRPITLTYTDLPHNDYSVLFRLLHGLLPGKEALGLQTLPACSPLPAAPASIGRFFRSSHWRLAFQRQRCTG
jgi:hypothetical protein